LNILGDTRLNPKTHKDLRNLLLACDELENNQSLSSLFVIDGLNSLENRLPDSLTKSERVDLLIAFLTRKATGSGESLLPVFLDVLQDRYKDDQKLHSDISNILLDLRLNNSHQEEKNETRNELHSDQNNDDSFLETASDFLNAIEKELRMNLEKYFKHGICVGINYWAILYFPEQINTNSILIDKLNALVSKLMQNKNIDITMEEITEVLKVIQEQSSTNNNLLDEALQVDNHHRLGKSARTCLTDILDQIKIVDREYTRSYGKLGNLSRLISEVIQLRLLLSNLNGQFRQINLDLRKFV